MHKKIRGKNIRNKKLIVKTVEDQYLQYISLLLNTRRNQIKKRNWVIIFVFRNCQKFCLLSLHPTVHISHNISCSGGRGYFQGRFIPKCATPFHLETYLFRTRFRYKGSDPEDPDPSHSYFVSRKTKLKHHFRVYCIRKFFVAGVSGNFYFFFFCWNHASISPSLQKCILFSL